MNNNPYAVLKRLGELYTDIVGGVSVKLWNVYGSEPITEKSHVIPDFIHQAIHTDAVRMRTAGLEQRLFLHSSDFAAALYIIFENYTLFLGKGAIDISCRTWVTVKEVATIVQDLTSELLEKEIAVVEGTYTDTFHSKMNQPIDSYLDTVWSPNVSLKEGVRSVYQSML